MPDETKKSDYTIEESDKFQGHGKPAVLRESVAFPFFFQITVPEADESSKNFPTLQNLRCMGYTIETDGGVTISSNLFSLLSDSEELFLAGDLTMDAPLGSIFMLDFIPKITWNNQSGGERKITFRGWTTAKDV